MCRVRELSIETSRDLLAFVKLFGIFTSIATPALEALTLDQGLDILPDSLSGFYDDWDANLFQGNAPNLRRLYVRSNCIQFRMQSTIFWSLTHLEITYHFLWSLERLEDLLLCMDTWTQLHALILQGS